MAIEEEEEEDGDGDERKEKINKPTIGSLFVDVILPIIHFRITCAKR